MAGTSVARDASYSPAPFRTAPLSHTPVSSNTAGTWPSKLGSLTWDLLRELFGTRLSEVWASESSLAAVTPQHRGWGWSAGCLVPGGGGTGFCLRLRAAAADPVPAGALARGSVLFLLNLRPAARGTLAGLLPGPAGDVKPVDSPPVCGPCPSPGERRRSLSIPGQSQESPNQPPAGPAQARRPSATQPVPTRFHATGGHTDNPASQEVALQCPQQTGSQKPEREGPLPPL